MGLSFKTDKVLYTFLETNIVLSQTQAGVNLTGTDVAEGHRLLAENISGHYALIVDRQQDYSLVPVSVFQVLNAIDNLKAIAIVTYRNSSKAIADIDRSLSAKPLQIFTEIEAAKAWCADQLMSV